MMNTTLINNKQRFFAFRFAFGAGMIFLGFPTLPLYSPFDPLGRRAGHEEIERQPEDFKPFVFNDGEAPAVPERHLLAAA